MLGGFGSVGSADGCALEGGGANAPRRELGEEVGRFDERAERMHADGSRASGDREGAERERGPEAWSPTPEGAAGGRAAPAPSRGASPQRAARVTRGARARAASARSSGRAPERAALDGGGTPASIAARATAASSSSGSA